MIWGLDRFLKRLAEDTLLLIGASDLLSGSCGCVEAGAVVRHLCLCGWALEGAVFAAYGGGWEVEDWG
jgi:hypothetical protein